MKLLFTLALLLRFFSVQSQDYGWQTIYSAGSNVIQYRIVVHHVKYLGDANNGWITKVFCRSTFPDDYVQVTLLADVAYPNDAFYHGKTKTGVTIFWGYCGIKNKGINDNSNDYESFSNIRVSRLEIGSKVIIKDDNRIGNYTGSNGQNNQSGNSGGNVANRPPNQPGGIPYGDDAKCLNCNGNGNPSLPPPPGRQKGIPYGNDAQCLNCGNEVRKPLPLPGQSKSKGIPYGNDSRCLNCGSDTKTTLPPPAQQSYISQNTPTKSDTNDDDGLSKVDTSNPGEVLRWSIKEFDKMSRETKCPATAAAYKKLADYFRCTLNGGDCGSPLTVADVPECPQDF